MTSHLRSTPALVVGLWAIWSTAFLAIKVGLTYATPEAFALMRVVAAVLVLAVVVLVRHRSEPGLLSDPRIHRYGLALGALNVACFLVFQNLGMADANVGLASVLIYTQPLLVALGARLMLREKLRIRQVVGLFAAWVGVILVVVSELDVGDTAALSMLLLLAAGLAWAGGTLLFKSLPEDVSVWGILVWQNLYGLAPVALMSVLSAGRVDWGWPLLVTVAWAGAGASIGGFGLQFVLLRRGQASVVSSWIFAVPILVGALGVVFLGETLHTGLALGGIAVAAGIYLVNAGPRQRATTSSELVSDRR